MTSIDVNRLAQQIDLAHIAGQRAALTNTADNEWAGPCPRCGGDAPFHVVDNLWHCEQCHARRGDIYEYYRWFHGLKLWEAAQKAAEKSGLDLLDFMGPETWQPTEVRAPNEAWQQRAAKFAEFAQGELWQDQDTLAWLTERGLTHDEIREAGLGYNAKPRRSKADQWGLDPVVFTRGVYAPPGWTIPCWQGDTLQAVRIRKPEGAVGSESVYLTGSEPYGVAETTSLCDALNGNRMHEAYARPQRNTIYTT